MFLGVSVALWGRGTKTWDAKWTQTGDCEINDANALATSLLESASLFMFLGAYLGKHIYKKWGYEDDTYKPYSTPLLAILYSGILYGLFMVITYYLDPFLHAFIAFLVRVALFYGMGLLTTLGARRVLYRKAVEVVVGAKEEGNQLGQENQKSEPGTGNFFKVLVKDALNEPLLDKQD